MHSQLYSTDILYCYATTIFITIISSLRGLVVFVVFLCEEHVVIVQVLFALQVLWRCQKNPVPAHLLLRASESGRPVGGRGAKTLTYTDLQQYILLSAVKDGSCYEYRFFNQVPFEDLSSFASHNNIVVAQVPLAKLVPFLTKRDAKSVLHIHGKSKLFREHDVHSDVVQSALHSHHCNTCVSMVSVFTTVATASARSKNIMLNSLPSSK